MSTDEFYRDNRANWDDRARVHASSDMYRIEEYVSNPAAVSPIVEYDIGQMGPVTGLRVAHLQCHVGTDTISFERLGAASVVGVDFSPVAIATARDMTERAGLRTRFVEASVYDAGSAVGHTVDLVYTSVGTICWLHDLNAWAAAISGLLEPGGRFYIRDSHPFLFVFDEVDARIEPTYPYWFTPDSPLSWDEADTYADNPEGIEITNTRHHEWNHSLPAIVNALVGAGMRIDHMDEHREIPWQFVPSCERVGDHWLLPEPMRSRLPAMFSLHATKR